MRASGFYHIVREVLYGICIYIYFGMVGGSREGGGVCVHETYEEEREGEEDERKLASGLRPARGVCVLKTGKVRLFAKYVENVVLLLVAFGTYHRRRVRSAWLRSDWPVLIVAAGRLPDARARLAARPPVESAPRAAARRGSPEPLGFRPAARSRLRPRSRDGVPREGDQAGQAGGEAGAVPDGGPDRGGDPGSRVHQLGPVVRGGTDLAELARASRDREDMYLIMKTLWARLDGRDEQWRNVYKAITAFEYLVANGAEEVVGSFARASARSSASRTSTSRTRGGRDQGINVGRARRGSSRCASRPRPETRARTRPVRPFLSDHRSTVPLGSARSTTHRPDRRVPSRDRSPAERFSRPLRPAPLTPRPRANKPPEPPRTPLARSSSTTRPRSRRSATRRSRTEASTAASSSSDARGASLSARGLLRSLGAASPSPRRLPLGVRRARASSSRASTATTPTPATGPNPFLREFFPTTRKTTPATTGTTTPTSAPPAAASCRRRR